MKPLNLLKHSLISLFGAWCFAVFATWMMGIGNDLQIAFTLGVAMVAGIILPVVFFLWTLPMHYLLKKYEFSGALWYVVVGFAPVPLYVFTMKPFGKDPIQYLVLQSLSLGMVGAVCAALFWVLVVRKGV